MTTSARILLGLVAYLLLGKLAFMAVPTALVDPGQAEDLTFAAIGVFAAMGLAGLGLSARAGFPPFYTGWRRLALPAGVGASVGVVLAMVDRAHPLGIPNVAFPMALLLYPFGAIVSEIMFRLFPLPLLTWLISGLVLRGRFQDAVFGFCAVSTSLAEPLLQWGAMPEEPWFRALLFTHALGMNLGAAFLFRRRGWLAALVLRLAFYVPWHLIR